MSVTSPAENLFPWLGAYPSSPSTPDPQGRSQDELAVSRGEGVELIPPGVPGAGLYPEENLYPGVWVVDPILAADALPGVPTLERLWQLANFDPFWYRNLAAAAGYIKAAWFASDPPPPIPLYQTPRGVPEYMGVSSSVGLFEAEVAPEFGAGA